MQCFKIVRMMIVRCLYVSRHVRKMWLNEESIKVLLMLVDIGIYILDFQCLMSVENNNDDNSFLEVMFPDNVISLQLRVLWIICHGLYVISLWLHYTLVL